MSRPWTPGPWVLKEGPEYSGGEGTYTIHPEGKDSWPNALLCDERYYPTAPEKMADAQLIALAPEMAEAILEASQHHGISTAMEKVANKLRAIEEDA